MMTKSVLLSAALALVLGTAAAFAQSSPPSPNASSGGVMSPNSVPGGQVSQPPGAGGNLGTTSTLPPATPYATTEPNTVRPMRTRRAPVRRPVRHRAPVVAPAASS